MRFPGGARRAAARLVGGATLATLSFCVGAYAATATEPAFAPGYCPAPTAAGADEAAPPWGEFTVETVGRSVQTAVFVDCFELAEWRSGERRRFSVYGAVTLYQGAALVASAFPALSAEHSKNRPGEELTTAAGTSVETVGYQSRAQTAPPRGLVQERIADGMLFRTRILEKGSELPAEPAAAAEGADVVAHADRLTLHLRGAALSEDGDAAIERSIVMPYRGDDSLRYLQASLLAGVSADRLTLLQLP